MMNREGSSYNNQESENQSYVNDSLMPYYEKIERSIDKYLLDEDDSYESEFDVSRLLRGDSKARADYYASGRQWSWLKPNEVRKMEGKNREDGGDVLHVPMNMEDINNPKKKNEREDK